MDSGDAVESGTGNATLTMGGGSVLPREGYIHVGPQSAVIPQRARGRDRPAGLQILVSFATDREGRTVTVTDMIELIPP